MRDIRVEGGFKIWRLSYKTAIGRTYVRYFSTVAEVFLHVKRHGVGVFNLRDIVLHASSQVVH